MSIKKPLISYPVVKEMQTGDELPYSVLPSDLGRQLSEQKSLIKCLAKQLYNLGLLTDPDLLLLIQS